MKTDSLLLRVNQLTTKLPDLLPNDILPEFHHRLLAIAKATPDEIRDILMSIEQEIEQKITTLQCDMATCREGLNLLTAHKNVCLAYRKASSY